MNLKCFILGHKLHWRNFSKVELNEVDGIGRQHATLRGKCIRCNSDFIVCRTHVPILKENCNLHNELNYSECDQWISDIDYKKVTLIEPKDISDIKKKMESRHSKPNSSFEKTIDNYISENIKQQSTSDEIREAFDSSLFITKIELKFMGSGTGRMTHEQYMTLLKAGFEVGYKECLKNNGLSCFSCGGPLGDNPWTSPQGKKYCWECSA